MSVGSRTPRYRSRTCLPVLPMWTPIEVHCLDFVPSICFVMNASCSGVHDAPGMSGRRVEVAAVSTLSCACPAIQETVLAARAADSANSRELSRLNEGRDEETGQECCSSKFASPDRFPLLFCHTTPLVLGLVLRREALVSLAPDFARKLSSQRGPRGVQACSWASISS